MNKNDDSVDVCMPRDDNNCDNVCENDLIKMMIVWIQMMMI